MFYYKFNLCYENFIWFGSKATKKKNFKSPQWLRNIKNRKYPFGELIAIFLKKKYNNIKFIENGWHFTCIKNPKEIHKSFSLLHTIKTMKVQKLLFQILKKKLNKKSTLHYGSDKKVNNKWLSNKTLKKLI